MKRNVVTGLRRRASRNPMRDYDRAPAPLRAWLADAALSWSAKSAMRVYERALGRSGGDVAAALAELDRRQASLLARDAACDPTPPASGEGASGPRRSRAPGRGARKVVAGGNGAGAAVRGGG